MGSSFGVHFTYFGPAVWANYIYFVSIKFFGLYKYVFLLAFEYNRKAFVKFTFALQYIRVEENYNYSH